MGGRGKVATGVQLGGRSIVEKEMMVAGSGTKWGMELRGQSHGCLVSRALSGWTDLEAKPCLVHPLRREKVFACDSRDFGP